jgi:hypothetical protein
MIKLIFWCLSQSKFVRGFARIESICFIGLLANMFYLLADAAMLGMPRSRVNAPLACHVPALRVGTIKTIPLTPPDRFGAEGGARAAILFVCCSHGLLWSFGLHEGTTHYYAPGIPSLLPAKRSRGRYGLRDQGLRCLPECGDGLL